jgi:heat shock protein HslJ
MRHIGPILLAAVLAGCYAINGASGAPAAGDANGSWILRAGTGPTGAIRIFDDHRITLVIDGDQAGGHAACNIYGGTVTINGAAMRLSAVSMTEMACAEDAAMNSEAAYMVALDAVTRWARDGDRLVLSGEDTQLTYQLEPPVADQSLVGTSWVLESLIEGEAASSVQGEAFLQFAADGSFTGMTGCRNVRGSYVRTGDAIEFSDLDLTGDCPAELKGQDSAVIDVLQGGVSAEIDGKSLTLTGNAGQGLAFRAAPGIE